MQPIWPTGRSLCWCGHDFPFQRSQSCRRSLPLRCSRSSNGRTKSRTRPFKSRRPILRFPMNFDSGWSSGSITTHYLVSANEKPSLSLVLPLYDWFGAFSIQFLQVVQLFFKMSVFKLYFLSWCFHGFFWLKHFFKWLFLGFLCFQTWVVSNFVSLSNVGVKPSTTMTVPSCKCTFHR